MSMTHDEMIAVIQAHKDGKQVQYRRLSMGEDDWLDLPDPAWDFSCSNYRIKPEPLILWAEYKHNGKLLTVYESAQEPKYGGTLKKFVEVTE